MKPELTIILPCQNEEKSLAFCLDSIKKLKGNFEIIVSDSSEDSSPQIASNYHVKLLKHDKDGYGAAYLEAFRKAQGKYIFMADADGSYSFEDVPIFIEELKKGYDLVLGDRFSGRMEKGAMPFLHRYLGNPLLSSLLRIFFKNKIKDPHSGMRAVRKSFLEKLNLRTTGMEFASEMIIKAIKAKGRIKEIPIDYKKREGKSKLKSFSDGWRHLRFMLLYSPYFLFFLPGLIIFLLGAFTLGWFYFGTPHLFGLNFYIHPMFISSLLAVLGYQLIVFSLFAKTYSIVHLGEEDPKTEKIYRYLTIEKATFLGGSAVLLGLVILLVILFKWLKTDFGALNEIKNSIVALTLIILGFQTIFSSFILSILGIKEK